MHLGLHNHPKIFPTFKASRNRFRPVNATATEHSVSNALLEQHKLSTRQHVTNVIPVFLYRLQELSSILRGHVEKDNRSESIYSNKSKGLSGSRWSELYNETGLSKVMSDRSIVSGRREDFGQDLDHIKGLRRVHRSNSYMDRWWGCSFLWWLSQVTFPIEVAVASNLVIDNAQLVQGLLLRCRWLLLLPTVYFGFTSLKTS